MHLLYLVSVLEGLETSKVVSAQERLCSQKFQFFLTSKKETVYDPLLTYIKICCCAQPLPPKKIPAFAGKIRSNLQFSEVRCLLGGLFCKVWRMGQIIWFCLTQTQDIRQRTDLDIRNI